MRRFFGGSNMGNGGVAVGAGAAPWPQAQHRGHAAAAGGGGVQKALNTCRSSYDAIIIGGGHNGLVTAAYLARAGRRVLVLERRELVGGCAVTEEIWPGYRVSTGAYLTSLLQERIVRELELERFGYRVDAKDPAFFSAFPDGRHFFMWQDRAKTLAEIAKFSTRDAEAYPAYEDQLERLSRVVEQLLLTTPPQFPPRGSVTARLPEAARPPAAPTAARHGRRWSRSSRRAPRTFWTSGSNRRR